MDDSPDVIVKWLETAQGQLWSHVNHKSITYHALIEDYDLEAKCETWALNWVEGDEDDWPGGSPHRGCIDGETGVGHALTQRFKLENLPRHFDPLYSEQYLTNQVSSGKL